MVDVSLAQRVGLFGVGFLAGTIDAMAGGGGLLTVPSLLAVGLPPHLAMGTNKGQSVFGSLAALFRYTRHGWVDGKRAAFLFPAGFMGSLGGAALLVHLRPEPLRPLILVLLVFAAVFVALRPTQQTTMQRSHPKTAVAAAGAIGAYDGFFGPGTGTFLIVAFAGLLGLPVTRASAEAKVVNFASNLAALLLFTWKGIVLWKIALPMASAQILGGMVGAHGAIRGGERWIRRSIFVVVTALILKLAVDLLRS